MRELGAANVGAVGLLGVWIPYRDFVGKGKSTFAVHEVCSVGRGRS